MTHAADRQPSPDPNGVHTIRFSTAIVVDDELRRQVAEYARVMWAHHGEDGIGELATDADIETFILNAVDAALDSLQDWSTT